MFSILGGIRRKQKVYGRSPKLSKQFWLQQQYWYFIYAYGYFYFYNTPYKYPSLHVNVNVKSTLHHFFKERWIFIFSYNDVSRSIMCIAISDDSSFCMIFAKLTNWRISCFCVLFGDNNTFAQERSDEYLHTPSCTLHVHPEILYHPAQPHGLFRIYSGHQMASKWSTRWLVWGVKDIYSVYLM